MSAKSKTCTEPGCDRPFYGRERCNKHYQAARSAGLIKRRTPEERFEEKADRSAGRDACHPWSGRISDRNQAVFRCGRHSLACRWGYERFVGPLLGNEVVRHTCDNGACVNPEHWLKGSQADNVRDCVERERTRHGEAHPRAIATDDVVREMRRLFSARRTMSYRAIGARYGLGASAAKKILTRQTWRHVRDAAVA